MGRKAPRALLLAAALLAAAAVPAVGAAPSAAEPPPGLASLQEFVPAAGPEIPFAAGKRASAVRLAALGFGARAGLARRAWEIAGMLDRHAGRLGAVYRFGDLVLRQDGFTVLPPVLAETRRAFRLEPAGACPRPPPGSPRAPAGPSGWSRRGRARRVPGGCCGSSSRRGW